MWTGHPFGRSRIWNDDNRTKGWRLKKRPE